MVLGKIHSSFPSLDFCISERGSNALYYIMWLRGLNKVKDIICQSQACFGPTRILSQHQGNPAPNDQTCYLLHMSNSNIGDSYNSWNNEIRTAMCLPFSKRKPFRMIFHFCFLISQHYRVYNLGTGSSLFFPFTEITKWKYPHFYRAECNYHSFHMKNIWLQVANTYKIETC